MQEYAIYGMRNDGMMWTSTGHCVLAQMRDDKDR